VKETVLFNQRKAWAVIGPTNTHHVSSQIDAEDGDSSKGQGHISQDEEQERRDLRDVGGQSVGNGLLQVVENETALLHTSDDGGEVVVEQNHVGGLLGHIGTSNTHGNTCKHKPNFLFHRLLIFFHFEISIVLFE